jgi:hypothetical protein
MFGVAGEARGRAGWNELLWKTRKSRHSNNVLTGNLIAELRLLRFIGVKIDPILSLVVGKPETEHEAPS